MRTAFVKAITEIAAADKNVWLLTGDLGFSVFEDFIRRFPKQYLNVGVAEQDMVGAAAGLALAGKKVFCYSISTFASMRAYEQIRNDVCYQNLPVFIMGGGSTFSYSTFGCTHFPLEDLGILRILPNMAVVCPGDPGEVAALVKQIYRRKGPAYMRMAKRGEPIVTRPATPAIKLGRASMVLKGDDATIIATGRQLPNAVAAVVILKDKGYNCGVLSMHTIKPFDAASVRLVSRRGKPIVTVEEHLLIGGLGSAVAEVIAETGRVVSFKAMGVADEFPSGVGSQDYFLKRYHLTPKGIAAAVISLIKARR